MEQERKRRGRDYVEIEISHMILKNNICLKFPGRYYIFTLFSCKKNVHETSSFNFMTDFVIKINLI